jgi:alpha-tubulin suppressor-like RCC1 family protein/uncharacterized protein YjbI with pentapeptide repeats
MPSPRPNAFIPNRYLYIQLFLSRRIKLYSLRLLLAVALAATTSIITYAQAPTPGQNINMVSGTQWPDGDPFLQRQNEPSIAVSTRNPQHLLAGANDYRTVDLNFFATGETGDAWLGIFKSFDAGASWRSTLLPGYPLDQTPEGKSSLLKPFNAASDPVVRAGPNGFFGYSGIAFNRGTNLGVVFFSRFVDLNNKENGTVATGATKSNTDPIRYVGTSVIAQGNATKFLDKPWMAIDIARGPTNCNIHVPQPDAPGGSVAQSLAVGNIYVAFTAFNYNNVGVLLSSQILFSRSVDCGVHWSTPIDLTATDDLSDKDHDSINQGPTIAIDPETGFVYVAWRRFRTLEHSDAIVGTASISGGQSFLPGIPIITLPPYNAAKPTGPSFFDQGTDYQNINGQAIGSSMRINAFPTLAVDDSGKPGIPGRVYLAWSQRGVGPNGDARIMMVTSPDGFYWPTPFAIDNGPLFDLGSEVLGSLGTPLTRGHQFMPQMTFTGGKLVVLYYDLRQDHTLGLFTPDSPFSPDSTGKFYQEARDPLGELPGSPAGVFTPFLDDAGLTMRRHTVDVVMAQFDPKSGPPISTNFTTARVSQYRFGLRNDGTDVNGELQQLQVDPPNFPLFQGGTTPFFGDYLDIAGLMMVPQANGTWRFNTGSLAAPVFHATWTDNRDVRPPKDGNWQNYTPVGGGGKSIFNGTPNTPACMIGNEGMRNQNIYTSLITQGLVVSSPQTSKPLSASLQRAFVVLVQNQTILDKSFRLTIANQPPGGFASFTPGTNNPGPVPLAGPPTPPSPVVTTLDIKVPAHSGIAASVFAVSSSATASITVNVNEISVTLPVTLVPGGLSSFVVLNADATNPSLINPDGTPANTNIASIEVYNPNFSNPNYSNPNYSNPNYSNPNFSNPNYSNPNYSNPNFSNPDIATSTVTTPNYSNGDLTNPNYSNPNYSNPNFSNTNLTATSVADASYTLTNEGDTSAGYDVNLVLSGRLPGNAQFQLLINKTYLTPVAQNCALNQEQTTNVQSVVTNPNFSNPNFSNPNFSNPNFSNSSLSLAPGESATVTLRGFNVTCSTGPRCMGLISGVANIEDVVTQVALLVTAQAANTNDPTNSHQTVAPLFVKTPGLPQAVNVSTYTPTTLNAIGGTPPYTWSISSGFLPAGLNLGPSSGLISGAPDTSAGTFIFTVKVTDSTTPTPNTATRQLSITVVNPLFIGEHSTLTNGFTGQAYGGQNIPVNGGTPPYTWSIGSGALPSGVTLNPSTGLISGKFTPAGTFTFTVKITDSSPTPLTVTTSPLTINITNPSLPHGLSFIVQPSNTVAGVSIAPPVQVQAVDAGGAILPGVAISIAIGSNPSGGTLSGTTPVSTDSTGIATFNNLAIDRSSPSYRFFDGTFNPDDWSASKILDNTSGASATFSESQQASGGNPGNFRQVVQTFSAGTMIVGNLLNTSRFSYNPSVQGTFSSIAYAYDLLETTPPPFPGAQVAYNLLLYQNGTYYSGPTDLISAGGWQTFAHTGLTASDFSNLYQGVLPLPGTGPSHPDFSSTGGLIQIGYISANSSTGGTITTTSGIDNYNLTVTAGYTLVASASSGAVQATSTGFAITSSPRKIAAGAAHACALLSGGTVQCWGDNAFGQLGNGTTTSSSTPVAVTGLSGATAIAAAPGSYHTCALLSDGTVQCWGANTSSIYGQTGQLGNGTFTDSSTPVVVSGLSGATAIAVGSYHTCALLSGGTVQCWGNNSSGQLGNGNTTNSSIPVPVTGLSGATAIAVGHLHTCALLSGGTVQCWGYNGYGQLGNGLATDSFTPVAVSGLSGAAAITAGGLHTCALLSGGTVQCWGRNTFGQLGNGSTTDSSTPIAVTGLSGAKAIAAGSDYTCALLSGGTVQCWGYNFYGQLGNGTTTDSNMPVAVIGLSGASALAAGQYHNCALISAGTVQCWGFNVQGQLGNGTLTNSSTPIAVSSLSGRGGATANTAGGLHTCALLSDGTVKCWGYNSNGQLGNGTTTNSSTPVAVSGLSGATAIAGGLYHTCALLSSGRVQCWGYNSVGQLGNGTTTDSSTPLTVNGLSGAATAIAAGLYHTCALVSDGTVQCWGSNSNGQLGNGTITNSSTPVTVSGLSGTATAIANGGNHTCALLADGTVRCWGYNVFGQLGDGTTTDSTMPHVVGGLSGGAKAITAGELFTCALLADGTAQCWGDNSNGGELGSGTTAGISTAPVTFIGLSGAKAIAANNGGLHACALVSGGTVQCWGFNAQGQLGNGNTTNSNMAVAVIGLSGATAIAAGANHTCALLSGGTVQCWGFNAQGQLGNGTTTNSTTPVAVIGLVP